MAKERAQCPFLKYPKPSSSSLLYGDHDYTVKSQFKVYLVEGIDNLNSKQRKCLNKEYIYSIRHHENVCYGLLDCYSE